MASYLRLPCDGIVMEVLGNGLYGCPGLRQGSGRDRARPSAGSRWRWESTWKPQSARATHMMESMRKTGDVDFHTPAGFTPD